MRSVRGRHRFRGTHWVLDRVHRPGQDGEGSAIPLPAFACGASGARVAWHGTGSDLEARLNKRRASDHVPRLTLIVPRYDG